MCPELDFSGQYRVLMKAYRLTPEAAARQLDAILKRFYAGREKAEQRPVLPRKGGLTT